MSVVSPDQVSIGVLVDAVPRDAVDEAVARCGVREKRSDGKLPAHVDIEVMQRRRTRQRLDAHRERGVASRVSVPILPTHSTHGSPPG